MPGWLTVQELIDFCADVSGLGSGILRQADETVSLPPDRKIKNLSRGGEGGAADVANRYRPQS